MDSKELQKLLDSLDEGPLGQRKDWQWNLSIRQKGESNVSKLPGQKEINSKKKKDYYKLNPEAAYVTAKNARKGITKQSRKQQGKKMKQWHKNAIEHKNKLIENFLGENNIAHREDVKQKKADTFRTTGRLFIELNSNSFGYVQDMTDKFNIEKPQIHYLATGERTPVRGKAVGLLFRFYDEKIHPDFSELNDIRKIKK